VSDCEEFSKEGGVLDEDALIWWQESQTILFFEGSNVDSGPFNGLADKAKYRDTCFRILCDFYDGRKMCVPQVE
jgi:hypothetical protein